MWIVLIFLNLWALHCTVSSSPPSPIGVTFSSVNLRNTLQWFPGNGTPDDTHFTVQYVIYGDGVVDSGGRRGHWRVVQQCTDTLRSWCDLTSETWDLENRYYARVRAVSRSASSKWALSERFDPKSDTSFGPPLVSGEMEDNSAIITLMGPMRYQPDQHTPVVSMGTVYPQMMYNLSIHNKGRGHMNHFTVVSSQYKYSLMEYNAEYCFSAKTKFLSMPVQCRSSEWHCITTPPDPVIGQLQSMVVGIAVSSVCLCILVVVGYLLHQYLMGKGQKSPYILNPPSFNQPPLTFPPENPNLYLITIIKPSDTEKGLSDPTSSKQGPFITDPPPGYAPQRSYMPPEPEDPWDDVSIEYGFVGAAPKNDVRGEEEKRENRPDRGEDGHNLKGEHQKCLPRDSFERKERKFEDGHLIGVYAPESSQTHMPINMQAETSPLTQFYTCSPVNSVPLTQSEKPLLSSQGTSEGDVNNKEDRQFPGLFINKIPQIGIFHMSSDPQTKCEEGMREEVDRKVRVRADGKIDGGVVEGSESERMSLLSAYASKNINMLTSCDDQSDFLPDDYGVLRLATANEIETDDDDEQEEEDERPILIDWDPMTRKLVLPEMTMEFTNELWLDRSMQGERGRENRPGGEEGEEEEVNAMRGKLMLENVFIRQASEEEAQRELEGGGEVDDIFAKWNLVISMDQ